jgi:hypothetical protein
MSFMQPLTFEQKQRLREIIYALETMEFVGHSGPLEDIVQFGQLRIMAGLPPASPKTTIMKKGDIKGVISLN